MCKKFEDIVKDEEMLVSLVESKSADEFVDILNNNGIVLDDITTEEAFAAFKSQANIEGELNENQLDDVAGGFFDPVSAIAIGATIATCSWLGATAYKAYKNASKRR